MGDEWGDFPRGHTDEHDLFLEWLGYLRRAVIRTLDGLTNEQARWTPEGALISFLGIVNHLTNIAGHADASRELLDGTTGE